MLSNTFNTTVLKIKFAEVMALFPKSVCSKNVNGLVILMFSAGIRKILQKTKLPAYNSTLKIFRYSLWNDQAQYLYLHYDLTQDILYLQIEFALGYRK